MSRDDAAPIAADGAEASATLAQIRVLIERAVDALPEPLCVVFMLCEIEKCSVEETAASLGLASATVKARLHRARRRLRQALGKKFAVATSGAFRLSRARCERIIAAVLERLATQGLG